ncbi:hypothetical protein V1264_002679 [Littorina saxatilis]|uniref:PNT domain-containing protein n=2 Tax=Littorina saxatilis TaxID=31220 RepID=A0AAN9B3D8_9CAEN
MTLRDFEDLDPENGNLLHTVFHNIVSDGRLDQLGEQPDEARTLTPINEVDSRHAGEHEEQDTSGDLAGHDTEGARGRQMSPHSVHGFPDLPNEQTTSRHRHRQHQRPPPSS